MEADEVVAAALFLAAGALTAWRAGRRARAAMEATDILTDDLHGHCYCGAVHYVVRRDATINRAAFCHCESCRRAHASPLYQVCYVLADGFAFTAGEAHVKAPPHRRYRQFCGLCGSRIANVMPDGRVGFFPSTLDVADQARLPPRMRPTLHHCPEEAIGYLRAHVLPDDGLRRQPNRYGDQGAAP